MSHLARRALWILFASSACSSPKPAASSAPEEPLAPAVVSVPVTLTEVPPPQAQAEPEAAPKVAAAPVVETLFVREQLADCQDEGARKCLQVREAEADEWRNFYGSIEGFDYDESYAYELRVEVASEPNPPADGASLRYRLLEVIAKRQVAPSERPQ